MLDRVYYRSLPTSDLVQSVRNDTQASEREIALADAVEDLTMEVEELAEQVELLKV